MTDLATLLLEAPEKLDGLVISGDEARTQLGIALLPEGLLTLLDLDTSIYLRISLDPNEDFGGIRRQGQDAVLHALRRGAASLAFYVENDTSAFKKKRIIVDDGEGNKYYVWRVIRPRWQKMLSDMRSGLRRACVVYDIDRLVRDNRDLEDAIEVCEFMGRRFEGATGSLDLNSDNGRAMARVMVAMGNKSSADTSRRTARKHRELAEQGEPVGGPRPFGFKQDRRTLDPAEAKEIKAAINKILAGVTVGSMLADWVARGVLTPNGNPWQWAPFMAMLRNPRICGYRGVGQSRIEENGRMYREWAIATTPDGKEVRANWEAIVPRKKWDALMAKIGKRAKPVADYEVGAATARKYLLTGLVRCGNCENLPRMEGSSSRSSKGILYAYYRCPGPIKGGCAGNARVQHNVNDLILELVFRVHDQAGQVGHVEIEPERAEELDGRLAEIEELLGDLYQRWKAKKLPSNDYFPMRDDLDAERKALAKEKAKAEAGDVKSELATDVRGRWDDPATTMGEKRAFIRNYLRAIIVHPIQPVWGERQEKMIHPKRFNPDLIEPVWIN